MNPRIVRLTEALLAIAIGLVIVKIFWTAGGSVLTPSAAPRQSVAPVAEAQNGPVDPFRTASGSTGELPTDFNAIPDLAETTLNLVLHGTWIDANGGAAIIKTPDEKQGRFAPGDVITNGVTLMRVYADQVIINRGGVRESLRLINREHRQVVPGDAPANSLASETMTSVGQFITASPQIDAVGATRLVLTPSGDTEAFEALGLRAGDLLVAIDNQNVSSDFAGGLEMLASLEGRPSVTLSVERDGVVMPVRINLAETAPTQ